MRDVGFSRIYNVPGLTLVSEKCEAHFVTSHIPAHIADLKKNKKSTHPHKTRERSSYETEASI